MEPRFDIGDMGDFFWKATVMGAGRYPDQSFLIGLALNPRPIQNSQNAAQMAVYEGTMQANLGDQWRVMFAQELLGIDIPGAGIEQGEIHPQVRDDMISYTRRFPFEFHA